MTTHRPSEQSLVEADGEKGWVRVSFLAIAILFNLCLVAQLLTVGLAVFSNPAWWQIHIWLVRGYGGLAAILLIGPFITPFSKRIQALTKGIAILLVLQFVTAHVQQPIPLGIVHPLTGFALFTDSTTLVHRVVPLVFKKTDGDLTIH